MPLGLVDPWQEPRFHEENPDYRLTEGPSRLYIRLIKGQIAQLVEHRTENPGVESSILSLPIPLKTDWSFQKVSWRFFDLIGVKAGDMQGNFGVVICKPPRLAGSGRSLL